MMDIDLGFADEGDISAFLHVECEAFGSRERISVGQQIDFTLIGVGFGLYDVALADAVWLCFADEVLADIYSIHAVSSAVSTYVYNEVW